MNKTMLNFNERKKSDLIHQESQDEKVNAEGHVSKPELSPTTVKVPLNPAFRHTEYAKGFYKVTNEEAAAAALAIQMSDSEVPATSADPSRNPLSLKGEEKKSIKSRAFTINPNANADIPPSQFHSTQETFNKPRTFGRKNYVPQGKAVQGSRMDETIYLDKF